MSGRGKRKEITPLSYTSTLTPTVLEDCFRKKIDELKSEFRNLISQASNSMVYLPLVTGFVYGDDQILYSPDSNVEQNAMPGQGNQVNITNNTVTLLIEQNIPFKVIIIPRILSNYPVLQREVSFDLKNNFTPEQSGKISAIFLLDIYLNPNYNLTPDQKDKIKQILINLDICNPTSIDWSLYIFLLMPNIYTNFVEDKSLQMVPKGGTKTKSKKNKSTKTRKTKGKRKTPNKTRKTRRKRH